MLNSSNSKYFALKLAERYTPDPNRIWPYCLLLLLLSVAKIAKFVINFFNCKIKDHNNFIWSWKSTFFFFCFLGPHPRHMEVPRLGVESKLQLPAYTTATAMGDLSSVCNLHHSSQQCWILNPLSKARDRTHILMATSWIRFCCATKGTPKLAFIFHFIST